jgi:hypothetical protein
VDCLWAKRQLIQLQVSRSVINPSHQFILRLKFTMLGRYQESFDTSIISARASLSSSAPARRATALESR